MTLLPPSAVGVTTALVLAQQPGTNDTPGEEEFGKSSPVGLVVLLLFVIAVVLLIRSMTKHLKRIPKSFDKTDEHPGEPTRSEDPAVEQTSSAGGDDSGDSGSD